MSNPTFSEFDPRKIPWQISALKTINNFDYSRGVLQLLCSGSIGSGKTQLVAHIIWRHVLENRGARCLVVRRALKDLKRTIWAAILTHISDNPQVIRSYNKTEMRITLINGSEIIGDSYDDMNLEKFRSLELSMAVIEEASESNKELYDAIIMRLGRCAGVEKNVMLTLTNPAGPEHYLYEKLISNPPENARVVYSLTEQNPFLPAWYLQDLRSNLDPKMAERMLYGKWVSIAKENVYYNYLPERNKRSGYTVDGSRPIYVAHDFNIGGPDKPMSAAAGQFIDGVWHWFKSYTIEGARTADIMEEMASDGLFSMSGEFIFNGDATGRARDTRSIRSDWDIIEQFVSNIEPKIRFEIDVPRANPPIRDRHNVVNAAFMDANGVVKMFIYDDWIDKGFRLTSFAKGSFQKEDDTLPQQHVTTAIGYAVYRQTKVGQTISRTIQL
jgi:hypothetical protein